jgi:hypothetical protein
MPKLFSRWASFPSPKVRQKSETTYTGRVSNRRPTRIYPFAGGVIVTNFERLEAIQGDRAASRAAFHQELFGDLTERQNS